MSRSIRRQRESPTYGRPATFTVGYVMISTRSLSPTVLIECELFVRVLHVVPDPRPRVQRPLAKDHRQILRLHELPARNRKVGYVWGMWCAISLTQRAS